MARAGLLLTLVCALLLATGLILGALSQHERFLEPDALVGSDTSAAAGNLIPLTGLLVAAGVAGGTMLLSRRALFERVLPGVALLLSTYVAVVLMQSSYPNYNVLLQLRLAQFAVSPITSNEPGSPSVLLPIFSLLLACILAAGWAISRLLGTGGSVSLPRRYLAAVALGTPFLAIGAAGAIRVAAATLQAGSTGMHVVFAPLLAVACLTLLATALLKVWHLWQVSRDARWGLVGQQAWGVLGRVEWAMLGLLALVALASSFAPRLELGPLQLGRTIGVTLRGHNQLYILLAVPLAPMLWLHRQAAHFLQEPHGLPLPATPVWLAAWLLPLQALLAQLWVWLGVGALWPWAVALLPSAAVALSSRDRVGQAPTLLIAAAALWSIGNTWSGTFDGRSDAGFVIHQSAWLMAAAAAAAAALVAWAIQRVLARPGGQVWATLAAVGCVVPVWIEWALAAWVKTPVEGEVLGVGSFVAGQDTGVAWLLHSASIVGAVVAAWALARLQRPDWFHRPPAPTTTVRGNPA